MAQVSPLAGAPSRWGGAESAAPLLVAWVSAVSASVALVSAVLASVALGLVVLASVALGLVGELLSEEAALRSASRELRELWWQVRASGERGRRPTTRLAWEQT